MSKLSENDKNFLHDYLELPEPRAWMAKKVLELDDAELCAVLRRDQERTWEVIKKALLSI
jgi:hypothetical protein